MNNYEFCPPGHILNQGLFILDEQVTGYKIGQHFFPDGCDTGYPVADQAFFKPVYNRLDFRQFGHYYVASASMFFDDLPRYTTRIVPMNAKP